MDSGDARNLTRSAQDAIRRQAVKAVVEGGMSQAMAAAVYGASHTTVCLWVKAYCQKGEAALKEWLVDHEGKIRLFLLPPYSPELNPDELANQDIKRNIFRDGKAKVKPELMSKRRGLLRSRQRRPHTVKKYFEGKYVAYAKAAR